MALQPDRDLWQSLPEQVEGKLVMNPEQPVLQSMQQERKMGYEKQLAPLPAKTKTDAELEKLQKDIKDQTGSNITGNSETQEDNLAYSSDTPTLTKTLYPQIAYTSNQTNGKPLFYVLFKTFNSYLLQLVKMKTLR